mgnify:CR=1 FL=1
MSKETVLLNQISNPDRKVEIEVLGLRFSPNSHVENIRAEFKKVLNRGK